MSLLRFTFRLWITGFWVPICLLGMAPKKQDEFKTAMAVLGDSISAGTFAQTQLSSAPENQIYSLQPSYSRFKWPEIPWIIQNKKTYSWASGSRVESHYQRFQKYLKNQGSDPKLFILNVARPGGTSDTLADQTHDLNTSLHKMEIDSLSYVVLLIGGNDLCDLGTGDEISLDQFRTFVFDSLSEIAQYPSKDRLHILVSSIPNIPNIGSPKIFQEKTWLGITCENLRRHIITYCNEMTLWENAGEYQRKVALVQKRNDVLRHTVEELMTLYPNVDFFYSSALFDRGQFSAQHLAFDCFHPSYEGQAMISKLLWEDQPWFAE